MLSTKRRNCITCADTEKMLCDVEMFSGKKKEDAEEFLETVDKIVLKERMAGLEVFRAVSMVVKAKRGAGDVPAETKSKRGINFRHISDACTCTTSTKRICGPTSAAGHRRTIQRFPYIVSYWHFVWYVGYPADERYLVYLACRNLHPTYRDALSIQVPMSLN